MGLKDLFVMCDRIASAFPLLDGEKANDVQASLMGIAAAESDYRYHRQIGFDPHSPGGGFGFWQMGAGEIEQALWRLVSDDKVRAAAAAVLPPGDLAVLLSGHPAGLLRMLQTPEGDAVAAVLARVWQLCLNVAVPDTVSGQAAWWKTHWNTAKGKGSVDGYLSHWASEAASVCLEAGRKVIV